MSTPTTPRDQYKVCPECRTFTKIANPRKTATICGGCGSVFILACPSCNYTIINPQAHKYCYHCGARYPWVRT